MRRKPLAPAWSASKTYSSRSKVVRISTRGGLAAARDDAPRRLEPVHRRHPDVHQHDVGPAATHGLDRLRAVRRLGDDAQVGLGLEDHPEAGAHERLVVGDEDVDAHAGDRHSERQPREQREPVARPPGAIRKLPS